MSTVRQAGAVVFRADAGPLRFLLVQSRKSPGLWVFPKGHIDEGESPEQTALRETHEEAGVTSELIGRVGPTLEFQSGLEWVAVDYFLTRWISEDASPEGRQKLWVPPAEAMERLSFESAREIVRTAIVLIDSWRRSSGRA
jgi:8-oxo-dGTP pyrophosphatase MutT (NUDIX family)